MIKKTAHSNLREREILDELRRSGGSSRVQFLADQLHISDETVRRNIRALELSGHVKKVHGGVYLTEENAEPPLHSRMNTAAEPKRKIAAEVASMIRNGDSLFLDTGSTTAYIAMALQDHHDLFVVTNSLAVAQALATRNNNRVYFAGGLLRPHDGGSFGLEATNFIRKFQIHYAIFTVGAINADQGFMLHDHEEAEFSRMVAKQASIRMIVADGSKFGRTAPMILDEPNNYQILVTDMIPPSEIVSMLEIHQVQLRVAGASA